MIYCFCDYNFQSCKSVTYNVTRFWEYSIYYPNCTSDQIKLTTILLVQTFSITQTTQGWHVFWEVWKAQMVAICIVKGLIAYTVGQMFSVWFLAPKELVQPYDLMIIRRYSN